VNAPTTVLLHGGPLELPAHLPIHQEHHPVGVRRDHRIVRHDHRGLLTGIHRLAQQAEDPQRGLGVQRASRLISEQQHRPGH
jgi:hypothetical protein